MISASKALAMVRAMVGLTMTIHGVTRALSGGVPGFGEFLTSQGFPFGVGFATLVTTIEIIGGPTLIAGRLIRPLAGYFACQLALGIALVHFKEGWFVVGGGRNGMEYSVVLIVSLLAVALAAPDARK